MPDRTFCSTCGTPTDGRHQFCERCGVFLGDPSWAPRDALVCSRCGAANAPGRADCGRCRTSLITGFGPNWECHVLGDVGAVNRPQPRGPLEPGACTTCGTANQPGQRFCGSCGTFLEFGGAVVGRGSDNDRRPPAGGA